MGGHLAQLLVVGVELGVAVDVGPAVVATGHALVGSHPLTDHHEGDQNGRELASAPGDGAADVLIGLREQELLITSATVQKPTLDEVFMALTGHGAGHAAEDTDHQMETVR